MFKRYISSNMMRRREFRKPGGKNWNSKIWIMRNDESQRKLSYLISFDCKMNLENQIAGLTPKFMIFS
jgi:hypothetical protein